MRILIVAEDLDRAQRIQRAMALPDDVAYVASYCGHVGGLRADRIVFFRPADNRHLTDLESYWLDNVLPLRLIPGGEWFFC